MTITGNAMITINGQARVIGADLRLTQLVSDVTGRTLGPDGTPADGKRLGVAVALNSEVVPRSRWSATAVDGGDAVEIVSAVQGG